MKSYLWLTPMAFLMAAAGVRAENQAASCGPKNYSELLQCLQRHSSEAKIRDQQTKSADQLESIAEAPINPELEVESVHKDARTSETNAALYFTVRLGGKKEALLQEARAQKQKAALEGRLGADQARLNLTLSLYRLSHLKSELEIEKESVGAYTKIIGQYQKRASLSPEQSVSLTVFRMSLADHQMKLAALDGEENRITSQLSALTGVSKVDILNHLPNKKTAWPEIESLAKAQSGDRTAPQVMLAEIEVELAQAIRAKAQSDRWPDLKVGPAFKNVREGSESNNFVGIGLSLPLPVLSQNTGARRYAESRRAEAELTLAQIQHRARAGRNELVEKYQQTVSVLKEVLAFATVGEKHQQIETQFFKGLVSSSLMIEAHRQLFELEERRNRAEFEAIEALGQILIMDQNFEGIIL